MAHETLPADMEGMKDLVKEKEAEIVELKNRIENLEELLSIANRIFDELNNSVERAAKEGIYQ